MPGKSRQIKGKHPHLSKKTRAMQRHGTLAAPPPAVKDAPGPATAASPPPPPRAVASPATSKAARYPYITSELRSIGIMAGAILVILIVLALVLS
ncbi:hypothetical protein ACFLX3_01310 [Chloroflexota bacterium]